MIYVELIINTNGITLNKKEIDAIYEFLNSGFSENSYEGTVSLKCLPAAIDPGLVEIIIDTKELFLEVSELAADIYFWKLIVKQIKNVCQNFKLKKPLLVIKKMKNGKEVECDVCVDSDESDEDIIEEIKKIQ